MSNVNVQAFSIVILVVLSISNVGVFRSVVQKGFRPKKPVEIKHLLIKMCLTDREFTVNVGI